MFFYYYFKITIAKKKSIFLQNKNMIQNVYIVATLQKIISYE